MRKIAVGVTVTLLAIIVVAIGQAFGWETFVNPFRDLLTTAISGVRF